MPKRVAKGSKVARSAKTRTDKTDVSIVAGPADTVVPVIDPPMSPDMAPADQTLIEPAPEYLQEPGLDVVADLQPDPEPGAIPQPAIEPPSAPTPHVTVQKVGLAPLVLGGTIAAVLGFAAAYLGQQGKTTEFAATLAAQADQIATLEAEIADLPTPPDPAPLTAALTQAQTEIAAIQSDLAAGISGLDVRLAALEKAPNADGTLSDTALAAWEREMETLRADVTAQQDRIQQIVDAATLQIDESRVEAATIEQNATEAAAAATARAALSRVQAALVSGVPYDAALGDLGSAVAVPDALAALAATGVPTITTLQADFPDAARAALAVARSEGLAGEEGGGLAGFLRNQFDVRSVTPQEGTTVDAILSRAEDALSQNHLSDTLAEIATLPEVVRAEMATWTSAAETRAAALAAVEGLSETLSSN